MNKETKDQIAREAKAYLGDAEKLGAISEFKPGDAYIAGAETWAERGEVLKTENEKMRKALEEIAAIGGQDEIFDIGGAVFNMAGIATEALKTNTHG